MPSTSVAQRKSARRKITEKYGQCRKDASKRRQRDEQSAAKRARMQSGKNKKS